ncbi:hypothetical protein [uncultured Algimonas sp.]|uniref:endonuclease III domain-containing protein n=1 Tax=uncultured Algimonas sp. TaxID=1547920 RepID=UPI002603D74E|nr:hypothetical protein [uncultured Algimonas sp.]
MDDRESLLRRVDARLRRHFTGFPPRYRLLDPVSQLVMSLLGGKTFGPVSRAAHARLVATYDNWSDVRDAPIGDIEAIIRPVTHWKKKAERLQRALRAFTDDDGTPDLDWLSDLTVEEGHRRLEAINGIGPKTAAAVLNTSTLRRRSLVIDTHHIRILERLRLLKRNANFVEAYRTIMPLVPQDWGPMRIDTHHMLFKRLGQVTCRHSVGHCHRCPLNDLCPSAAADGAFG